LKEDPDSVRTDEGGSDLNHKQPPQQMRLNPLSEQKGDPGEPKVNDYTSQKLPAELVERF
jgi:hypothetical protein